MISPRVVSDHPTYLPMFASVQDKKCFVESEKDNMLCAKSREKPLEGASTNTISMHVCTNATLGFACDFVIKLWVAFLSIT